MFPPRVPAPLEALGRPQPGPRAAVHPTPAIRHAGPRHDVWHRVMAPTPSLRMDVALICSDGGQAVVAGRVEGSRRGRRDLTVTCCTTTVCWPPVLSRCNVTHPCCETSKSRAAALVSRASSTGGRRPPSGPLVRRAINSMPV